MQGNTCTYFNKAHKAIVIIIVHALSLNILLKQQPGDVCEHWPYCHLTFQGTIFVVIFQNCPIRGKYLFNAVF